MPKCSKCEGRGYLLNEIEGSYPCELCEGVGRIDDGWADPDEWTEAEKQAYRNHLADRADAKRY